MYDFLETMKPFNEGNKNILQKFFTYCTDFASDSAVQPGLAGDRLTEDDQIIIAAMKQLNEQQSLIHPTKKSHFDELCVEIGINK